MELNGQYSPQENMDSKSKATFRKPSNDAGNRKYRRRSPENGSSSSEGSPVCERNSSPVKSRKDPERGSNDRRKKEDSKYLDRESGRTQYSQSGDLYRHLDRHATRNSRSYRRHDDYHRRDKYTDDDRDYSRSCRSNRDSRSNYSDHSRRENEHRLRDHSRDVNKQFQDKSDSQGDWGRDKERENSSLENQKQKEKDVSSDKSGSGSKHASATNDYVKSGEKDRYKDNKVDRDDKMECHRSSGDRNRSPAYEYSRSHKNETSSRRDNSGHRLKESSRSDHKSMDGENYAIEEKKNFQDQVKHGKPQQKEAENQFEDRKSYYSRDQESSAKKPKLFTSDGSNTDGKDVMKAKGVVVEKQAPEPASKVVPEQPLTDSDIDAAKIAAMKAAELVNQNLVGTGYMSADQKKKLLWGNKKAATTEESGNRWDTAIFGDPDRQEKFNKLMSLRLHWYLWPIVGCEGGPESGEQAQLSPSREAEGAATVGFGEAVHSWTSSKRWSHCWTRSLIICRLYLYCLRVTLCSAFMLYYLAGTHIMQARLSHSFWFMVEIPEHDDKHSIIS